MSNMQTLQRCHKHNLSIKRTFHCFALIFKAKSQDKFPFKNYISILFSPVATLIVIKVLIVIIITLSTFITLRVDTVDPYSHRLLQ